LLSILGSLLIGMNITFSGPATAIPQSAVHYVSRTIIFKCLSWSIDVSFILNMLMNIDSFFSTEFSSWYSWSENLTWMAFWVNKWGSESGLWWHIWSMVTWMS
jgi:hypothetical protein